MFGLSAFLAPFAAVGAGSVPVITGINYDIIDIAGSGQRIVIAVTDSTGCTGATIGGVALTSFAIDDATHVSGIAGAHAAGVVDVVVTNGAGPSTTGTGMVEYWSPASSSVAPIHDFDPHVASSLTMVASKVSVMNDLVGVMHQRQTTDASRPTLNASDSSYGGKTTLNMSASCFIPDADASMAGPITEIVIGHMTVDSCAFLTSYPDASPYNSLWRKDNHARFYNYPPAGGITDVTDTTTTVSTPTVIMFEDDMSAGTGASRICATKNLSVFPVAKTTLWKPTTKLGVGYGNAGISKATGTIARVLIFGGILTQADKVHLAGYLSHRYGLAVTASGSSFAVTSISPTSGTERGGTSVTITGTGFTGATSASVGGLTLNSFTVVNDTTITGTTKMQPPGLKSISVTNGTTETKTNAYTFNAVGKYTSGIPFRGINRAGPEYGEEWDGWNGQSWFEIPTGTPLANEIAHFKSKGFNVIRLPFSWNRMQHTLNGALASTYSTNYKNLVTALTNAGFRVIVDCHNYVRYATSAWSGDTEIAGFTVRTLGDGTLTMAHLVDLWTKVAGLFVDNHYVQFGLMNEAHNFTLNNNTYYTGLNSIIAAIRGAGATSQLILVPNSDGSNVEHWSTWTGTTGGGDTDDVNALTITDSANNYAFDFHCYIDNPGSSTAFNTKLAELTTWLRTNGKKGYLTEGFSNKSSANGSAAFGNLMSYLNTNNDVWIGITPWNLDPYEYTIQDGNGAHTIDGTCMSWYSPYLTSGIVT